jgi:hypothetical protein
MLHDPTRHETLQAIAWDEGRARNMIERIVRDTEAHFSPAGFWPLHPRDVDAGEDPNQPAMSLYYGACGVEWALQHLQALGAVKRSRSCIGDAAAIDSLLERNRACLQAWGSQDFASYLAGDTPIHLLAFGREPTAESADVLAALIAGNIDHPARELMWGAPGTLLAALFLHQHTGEARWAALFRESAAKLWSQLQWSPEHACHHWTQDMYGRQSTYLDGVHGFVATASPLIRGRHLLGADTWAAWQACIANTTARTATWDGEKANWRALLDTPAGQPPRMLMQFCHGAPGFVVCLGDFPGTALDALLTAAGEAIWAAGPLIKGSNLCHGTGGNGYAFMKLYRRTGDALWLERARAFAMHGITQTEADAQRYGRMRYSLWTGDLGFAIYLWDCLNGSADFPTLDVFFADTAAA